MESAQWYDIKGEISMALTYWQPYSTQRARKVVSDSPGLVDFALGLVNSVINLSDGQVKFKLQKKCETKRFWG